MRDWSHLNSRWMKLTQRTGPSMYIVSIHWQCDDDDDNENEEEKEEFVSLFRCSASDVLVRMSVVHLITIRERETSVRLLNFFPRSISNSSSSSSSSFGWANHSSVSITKGQDIESIKRKTKHLEKIGRFIDECRLFSEDFHRTRESQNTRWILCRSPTQTRESTARAKNERTWSLACVHCYRHTGTLTSTWKEQTKNQNETKTERRHRMAPFEPTAIRRSTQLVLRRREVRLWDMNRGETGESAAQWYGTREHIQI